MYPVRRIKWVDDDKKFLLQGALVGGICSTLFVGWISLGTQAAMMRGEIVIVPKPTSIEGCPGNFSFTTTTSTPHSTVEFDR